MTRIWFYNQETDEKCCIDMENPVIPRVGEMVDGIGQVYGKVTHVHYLYFTKEDAKQKVVVNVFVE